MNKKLVLGILAIAIVAAAASATVLSDTWLDTFITLNMHTGSLQSLGVFTDCAATVTATSHDFGVVTQGNTYEWTIYVYNTGSDAMNITYLPTTYAPVPLGGQVNILIKVDVIEYGAPCQMSPNVIAPPPGFTLPYALEEKLASQPSLGWPLMPTKMIKLDIKLTVNSVVVGGVYAIPFEIAGVA